MGAAPLAATRAGEVVTEPLVEESAEGMSSETTTKFPETSGAPSLPDGGSRSVGREAGEGNFGGGGANEKRLFYEIFP